MLLMGLELLELLLELLHLRHGHDHGHDHGHVIPQNQKATFTQDPTARNP